MKSGQRMYPLAMIPNSLDHHMVKRWPDPKQEAVVPIDHMYHCKHTATKGDAKSALDTLLLDNDETEFTQYCGSKCLH